MIKLKIDNKNIEVEPGTTILQACEIAGKEIPRFCYHEKLSIAGNCRMCLVEVSGSKKPVASCAMPAVDGQEIKTNSEMVKKAREGVMEFLLVNHPLDCPICDQGGECDLQDQAFNYGGGKSRYELNKRSVKEKNMGPLIKTHMNRCIHCTRCIRFAEEVAGVEELGAINRGENMEISTYLEKAVTSEFSANLIDLCPVGALTSKPYAFEARPWELKKTESVDVMDAIGSNIRIDSKGWEVKRILPKINEDINEEWISDKTRFSCDGLLNNRIDSPYIKINGKLTATSWGNAFEFIKSNVVNKKSFSGLIGQLVDVETTFAFKEFFKKVFNSNLIDFRQKNLFLKNSSLFHNIFNTPLNDIHNSDLILLIGANPRHEASILNLKIRKAIKSNQAKVFSIGNIPDQTYKVHHLGDNIEILNDIDSNNIDFSKVFYAAKKPIIIIGESVLNFKIGNFVIEKSKSILSKANNLSGFNILHQNASSVGSIILESYNNNFKNLLLSDVIFLLNADEVKIDKQSNQFIIYQGTHGGENASLADVVLPGAAFTEKEGIFVNLEGRPQLANKASYPPGNAKEDWKIIKALSDVFNKPLNFNSLEELREQMFDKYPILKDLDCLPTINYKDIKIEEVDKIEQNIKLQDFKYYKSNIIARQSITMHECENKIFKINQPSKN